MPPNCRSVAIRSAVWRPSIRFIAWKTGPACGLIATRSAGFRMSKYSAVMMEIDRGAGGLVPAHLQPIPVGADVVGIVDHPGREPEQLALDGIQQRKAAGFFRGADQGRLLVHGGWFLDLRRA
jgi:hypothetical protein